MDDIEDAEMEDNFEHSDDVYTNLASSKALNSLDDSEYDSEESEYNKDDTGILIRNYWEKIEQYPPDFSGTDLKRFFTSYRDFNVACLHFTTCQQLLQGMPDVYYEDKESSYNIDVAFIETVTFVFSGFRQMDCNSEGMKIKDDTMVPYIIYARPVGDARPTENSYINHQIFMRPAKKWSKNGEYTLARKGFNGAMSTALATKYPPPILSTQRCTQRNRDEGYALLLSEYADFTKVKDKHDNTKYSTSWVTPHPPKRRNSIPASEPYQANITNPVASKYWERLEKHSAESSGTDTTSPTKAEDVSSSAKTTASTDFPHEDQGSHNTIEGFPTRLSPTKAGTTDRICVKASRAETACICYKFGYTFDFRNKQEEGTR
ncbi:hypothetical protein IQ07DRAFT_637745 [Pyrenochaeta sp. DS3sAY3a]|nr:hypothetical protein IQ07DRAFT_637745 [Pyrenochaeta sp. DS3sAY3a]